MRHRISLTIVIAALPWLAACASSGATKARDLPAEHRVGWLGCGNAEASSIPATLMASVSAGMGARMIDVVATQPAPRRSFALAISVAPMQAGTWDVELRSGRTTVNYASEAAMVRCEAEGASLNADATLSIRSSEAVVVFLRETGVAGGRAVRVEPGSTGQLALP